jgi:oligoribonuclease NrnB/cAMP/cGMP phosphodiesterase (DHH superfamily)
MIKLLTHNDLDGAGCAILAKLAWKDNVEIQYCGYPDKVTSKLQKLASSPGFNKYSRIYVTDCRFNSKLLKQFPVLHNKLCLFDHHTVTVDSLLNFPWAVIRTNIGNRMTCGTEMFYYYLKVQDAVPDISQFVELVRLYDTWDWESKREMNALYLSQLVDEFGVDFFVKTFAERLKNGNIPVSNLFSPTENLIIRQLNARIEKDIVSYCNCIYRFKIQKFLTSTGRKEILNCGMLFCDHDISLIGNEVARRTNLDIVFILDLNKERIRARTRRDDINIGELMARVFDGGGHQKAAGGFLLIPNKFAFIQYLFRNYKI